METKADFVQTILDAINSTHVASLIQDPHKKIIADTIAIKLMDKAQHVEDLFDPDFEGGLEAIPLLWTKHEKN